MCWLETQELTEIKFSLLFSQTWNRHESFIHFLDATSISGSTGLSLKCSSRSESKVQQVFISCYSLVLVVVNVTNLPKTNSYPLISSCKKHNMCDDKRRCGFTVPVRSWTSVESRHHNEGSISAEKRDIIFQRCSCFMILRLTHHRWGPVIINHLCVGRGWGGGIGGGSHGF